MGYVGTGWGPSTGDPPSAGASCASPLYKPIKKRDTTWVGPRLDAEITYAEITYDGMARHPSFKRLLP